MYYMVFNQSTASKPVFFFKKEYKQLLGLLVMNDYNK